MKTDNEDVVTGRTVGGVRGIGIYRGDEVAGHGDGGTSLVRSAAFAWESVYPLASLVIRRGFVPTEPCLPFLYYKTKDDEQR